jgi:hypothetical protein
MKNICEYQLSADILLWTHEVLMVQRLLCTQVHSVFLSLLLPQCIPVYSESKVPIQWVDIPQRKEESKTRVWQEAPFLLPDMPGKAVTTHEFVLLETADLTKGTTWWHLFRQVTLYKIPLFFCQPGMRWRGRLCFQKKSLLYTGDGLQEGCGRVTDSSYHEFFNGREQTRLFIRRTCQINGKFDIGL